MARNRYYKKIRYTCKGSRTLESAAAHWEGFTWQGGGWRCILSGPWGMIQVWAASKGEGERVIRHACAHAGIDPEGDCGVWSFRNVGGRFGTVRSYRTGTLYGSPWVTARDGPNGPPEIVA